MPQSAPNYQVSSYIEWTILATTSYRGVTLLAFGLTLLCRVHVNPRGISEENKETTTQEEVGEEQVLFEEVQDELELVELRPLISRAQKGGVENIVNLQERLKSPRSLVDEI